MRGEPSSIHARPRPGGDRAEEECDRKLELVLLPGAKLRPGPLVHADFASLAALSRTHHAAAPPTLEVGLAEREHLTNAKAGAPQHDGSARVYEPVAGLAGLAHHRGDLLRSARVGRLGPVLLGPYAVRGSREASPASAGFDRLLREPSYCLSSLTREPWFLAIVTSRIWCPGTHYAVAVGVELLANDRNVAAICSSRSAVGFAAASAPVSGASDSRRSRLSSSAARCSRGSGEDRPSCRPAGVDH